MDEYEILNKVLKKYRYKISEEEYPTIEFIGKHDLPWGLLILILLIILQIFLQKGITIIKLISIICVGSLLFLRMRDRSKIGKFNLSVKKFEILNSGLLITNFLNIQTLVHKDRFPNLEVIEFEDSADDIVLGFTTSGMMSR